MDTLGHVGLVPAVVKQLDHAVLHEDELLAHNGAPVSVQVGLILGIIRVWGRNEPDGREVRPFPQRPGSTIGVSVIGQARAADKEQGHYGGD